MCNIESLPCLSVRQPWTDLIIHGHKPVENRTWQTNVRGPVLLHAGKNYDVRAYDYLSSDASGWSLARLDAANIQSKRAMQNSGRLGAIVGACVIDTCTRVRTSDWHYDGHYGFYISYPMAFRKPVPHKGRLDFFPVRLDIVRHEIENWLKDVIELGDWLLSDGEENKNGD